jgi:hypothetical protein
MLMMKKMKKNKEWMQQEGEEMLTPKNGKGQSVESLLSQKLKQFETARKRTLLNLKSGKTRRN